MTRIQFYLRFSTGYGESLYICGNHSLLGNDNAATALPMQYLNNDFWTVSVELEENDTELRYNYLLHTNTGEQVIEWGDDRILQLSEIKADEYTVYDTWNHAGEFENAFFTQPFQQVLLKRDAPAKLKTYRNATHVFRVKAPLLKVDEVLCISGSNNALGNWEASKAVALQPDGNWWTIKLNLSKENIPFAYKYAVINAKTKQLVQYESGNNRMMYEAGAKKKITITHDGFAQLPNATWHGAGLSVPIFSLRTKNSFGVGEFTDIKLLIDWAMKMKMKLVQILPINDTTATHTWMDSYPYAPISVFALHPQYLNLEAVAGDGKHKVIKSLAKKQKELNALNEIDYEAVMKYKWDAIKELYEEQKAEMHDDVHFFEFFDLNRHWLVPYAAFCYLRDKYKTADFKQWKTHSDFNEEALQDFVDPSQKHYDEIAIHYFVQYELHLQLKEAVDYAHEQGVILKGDIPIGIYRNSVDAWMAPELYNMNKQAGAPPDDFAIKGQNWGFPTYNWQRMAADGFKWWRQRFEQMSVYFDAFRIDHILGFFRIWSIPLDAVEGILGHFVPALPVHINEFGQRGMWFDYGRLCKPYITDAVLKELMGNDVEWLRPYIQPSQNDTYKLKEEFNTQRKVEAFFDAMEQTADHDRIRHALYDLISNVILFEVEGSQAQQFHFRISMSATTSFKYLDADTKAKLEDLFVNYFFRRQDEFWRKEALDKLPFLKRSTNMLICGEDLGMVPDCVPGVMKQLGFLSLEIQRMPKDPKTKFFHPADAPYLSVVTPSTHDMSTIRGWWEEDRAVTQSFYNTQLGQWGDAPYYCEPNIVRSIITQHFYSPAMWSIFQVQELLGMSAELRRENPNDERINVPANPKHYWRYRMHLNMEDLVVNDVFNDDVKSLVEASGRG
jgi:4-alpha-glucanotransferase